MRPEDLKYIKDSFKMNDTNKTSQLNIDELREALNKYGIEIEEDENLKKLFDEAEKNGKASIDFDEFINLVNLGFDVVDSPEGLKNAFCLFLGDEKVDKIEYRHLKRECPYFSDDEINTMISGMNEEGKVDFNEFEKIITK